MSSRTTNGRLGFVREARKAFAFLDDLDFREVYLTDTMVEWEGPAVGVRAFHGPQSYIMGVELRRLSGTDAVGLGDALQVISPNHAALARYQTSDPARVAAGVGQLASLLQTHCRALLAGEPSLWGPVEDRVREQREALTLHARFHGHRQRADQAWQAKDYTTARSLYREMKEALTEPEQRRLDYLERKLDGPGSH